MRTRWCPASAVLVALSVLSSSCDKAASPTGTAPAPSASVVGSGLAVPPAPLPAIEAPVVDLALSVSPACRAVRVMGGATVGASPLVSGALLEGKDWVTLAAGASVALKHTSSAREWAVTGPALFRACRQGREQILLVRGTLVATAGAGARPGAEVLVATPVAVVRYTDATLTLTLDAQRLRLSVRSGQADVEAVDSGKPAHLSSGKAPGEGFVTVRDKFSLPVGQPKPQELVARCGSAAGVAETSARRVADRSAPEPLGERAQAHVRARKAARAACTVAAAATGLVADPQTGSGLWAEVVRWEGLWETIPRPGRALPPEK